MNKEKQTVNGDVGNVVSGDVTIHNYSAEVSPAAKQPISLLQKRDLHRLMDELVVLGESKRELWLVIHTKRNTKTVNEMTAADYHCAVEILQERALRIRNLKDCNILVSKIMTLTDPTYRLDRDRYCLKHFGTTHLKGLDKEQLQEIFGYFDDLLNSDDESKILSQIPEPVSGGRKPYVILTGVIMLAAAVAVSIGFAGKWRVEKKEAPSAVNTFNIETSNKIIEASVPALRDIFPRLSKYHNDLHSVSGYKQKSGWHTLKFTVSAQASIPENYNVKGKTCYININPDGSYARVLTAQCRSLLLDQQSTPDSKYRFILK
ncbi:hypothetical protein CYG68_20915 [Morganella morganii]|uniref:Uncharacterized protein n=1 Tax=Morganella morganii TaxID=582 RepID=A0A8I0PYR3_MORMO|nr:hypothetical protein [Morganella morganii]MBE8614791.1 hypothetical protein [Morganella morganii]